MAERGWTQNCDTTNRLVPGSNPGEPTACKSVPEVSRSLAARSQFPFVRRPTYAEGPIDPLALIAARTGGRRTMPDRVTRTSDPNAIVVIAVQV